MTSFPPFSTVDQGISHAGLTLQEVPIIKHKSEDSPFVNPASNSSYGRFSPKFMIESNNLPLQSGSSHNLPV